MRGAEEASGQLLVAHGEEQGGMSRFSSMRGTPTHCRYGWPRPLRRRDGRCRPGRIARRSEWHTPRWATRNRISRNPGPVISTSSITTRSWLGASSIATRIRPLHSVSARVRRRTSVVVRTLAQDCGGGEVPGPDDSTGRSPSSPEVTTASVGPAASGSQTKPTSSPSPTRWKPHSWWHRGSGTAHTRRLRRGVPVLEVSCPTSHETVARLATASRSGRRSRPPSRGVVCRDGGLRISATARCSAADPGTAWSCPGPAPWGGRGPARR